MIGCCNDPVNFQLTATNYSLTELHRHSCWSVIETYLLTANVLALMNLFSAATYIDIFDDVLRC